MKYWCCGCWTHLDSPVERSQLWVLLWFVWSENNKRQSWWTHNNHKPSLFKIKAGREEQTLVTLLVLATFEGGRGASGLCGISSSGATSGFRAKTLSRSIWGINKLLLLMFACFFWTGSAAVPLSLWCLRSRSTPPSHSRCPRATTWPWPGGSVLQRDTETM